RDVPLSGHQLSIGVAQVEACAERLADFSPKGDHARVGVAAHSVRAVPVADLSEVVGVADSGRLPLHVHVSEQPAENVACLTAHGRTPTRVLADAGALTERTSLVHATHLTDADVADIRRSKATVCLCPTTERDLADGLPRTGDLMPAPLSQGTAQQMGTALFEEARGAELHARWRTLRRGTSSPGALRGAATSHSSLAWTDAGVSRPVARADLVNVSLESTRLAGADPERARDAVIFAATATDVRH